MAAGGWPTGRRQGCPAEGHRPSSRGRSRRDLARRLRLEWGATRLGLSPAPLVDIPAVAGDILIRLDADQPLLLQITLVRPALRGERHLVEQDFLDLCISGDPVRLLGLS